MRRIGLILIAHGSWTLLWPWVQAQELLPVFMMTKMLSIAGVFVAVFILLAWVYRND